MIVKALTAAPRYFSRDDALRRSTTRRKEKVRTIDEMLTRRLLTPAQHHEIRAWISAARTPEGILEMPVSLWRSLELASVLMGVDADLTLPPCFDGAG